MSSGLFAKAALNSGTTRLPWSPAAGTFATINIRLVNDSAAAVDVRVGIGPGLNIAADDVVQASRAMAPGAVIEHTGIVVSPGEYVIVNTSAAGVVCRVHGIGG